MYGGDDLKEKIGVMGVGLMGRPIAENLKKAGFDVFVYDKKSEVLQELTSEGLIPAKSARELAEKTDIILDVLNDTSSLNQCMEGEDGLLVGLSEGKIIIDMTTSDPEKSVPIGKFLKEKGVYYLDCPMTGGMIGAQNRELVIMAGGDKEVFEKIEHILKYLSKELIYLGPSGSGHYMKLIHNQLSHSTFLAACEAYNLGRRLGMDKEAIIKVFNVGNARSYATEVRFPKFILSGTFKAGASFYTVGKDISLVAKKANQMNFDLPITRATYDYWRYAIEIGHGDDDYSTIVNLMDEKQKNRDPK